MPVVVREQESTFAVTEGFVVPDLRGVGPVVDVEGPERSRLEAVYHDTADLRLAREGITLRRRTGGSDAGWHLELPVAGSDARDEVRLPLAAGETGQVPAELRALVTAVVRREALVPVSTLRTDRTVLRLRAAGGEALAEVALDEVSVLAVGGAPVPEAVDAAGDGAGAPGAERFTELEVELVGAGDEAGLDEVRRALVAAGATATGPLVPEAVRALGPAAATDPEVPAPPARLSREAPAADLVRAHVATQVRALRAADLGVRRGQDDAVHQTRVAARRLRSGLRVFRPLLERERADELRAELAWLAGSLGGARDGEVLADRLSGAVGDLPPEVDVTATAAVLEGTLTTGTAQGRVTALAAMDSDRYLALLDRLVEAAATPPTTPAADRPCADVLPALVGKAWRRLARGADALRPDGDDDAWHEVRKSAKAARYAAEAVRPALGKPAKRLARQVERVTEVLGEHQDAAVAATALTRLAAAPRVGTRAAFGLGVLYAAQRDDVETARREFLLLWPEVSRRKHRRWLA